MLVTQNNHCHIKTASAFTIIINYFTWNQDQRVTKAHQRLIWSHSDKRIDLELMLHYLMGRSWQKLNCLMKDLLGRMKKSSHWSLLYLQESWFNSQTKCQQGFFFFFWTFFSSSFSITVWKIKYSEKLIYWGCSGFFHLYFQLIINHTICQCTLLVQLCRKKI